MQPFAETARNCQIHNKLFLTTNMFRIHQSSPLLRQNLLFDSASLVVRRHCSCFWNCASLSQNNNMYNHNNHNNSNNSNNNIII
mmetsp:Transcript_15065/g.26798  ORF Transcript_15065/g.26798 Transcript_15065/m.26798 type:complete len:84 (-) Transcript_15065:106-357(-)